MAEDFEVIDADGHITEREEELKEFMEYPYRNRRARLFPSGGGNWDRSVFGRLGGATAKDAKSWLAAMDRGGVSAAVLFPTGCLGFGWVREPDYAVALAKAYNNFVTEKFQKVSPRLKPVALIPLQDVLEGARELQRAVEELGLVGAMLPAVGLRKPLGHPDYWPIYEEAERLGCMLGVHATVGGPHYFGGDLFDYFIDLHTISHPFAQMIQMTSIILRGVPERFPRLRIAFMEAGCTWVPYWLGRMDEEWEKRGEAEAPLCKRRPSEYVTSGGIYFPAEDYEPLVGATASLLGAQVLYYASDWPHWDSEFPKNIDQLKDRKDLSPEAKKWILAETAKKLYKLNGSQRNARE